jgi:hypothetical protein
MQTNTERLYAEGVASLEGLEEHWLDERNPADVQEASRAMVSIANRYVEVLSLAVEQEKQGFLFDAEDSVLLAQGIANSAHAVMMHFLDCSLAHAREGRSVYLGGEDILDSGIIDEF